MAVKTIKAANFSWHYISGFDKEELDFLKKNFKFHPLDLKDITGGLQRSKLDSYKNYLFLIFQLPILDRTNNQVSITQVYFFIGKNFLITISNDRNKALNSYFYKVLNNQKSKEEFFGEESGYAFYRILESVLWSSWDIHEHLDKQITKIERNIDEGTDKSAVFAIADMRRAILKLKSIVDPQKLVTNTLSRTKAEFMPDDIRNYFDDIDDYVEKNWFILESYKDRVLTLHEINESLISYRTTNVIKILTIFSVAFLPLTLLSGIYGMNIDLPLTEHPGYILSMFAILLVFILGVIGILKKNDWI